MSRPRSAACSSYPAGDIPMTVQAMKAGAVEFLPKPFHEEVLLSAIGNAIERSRAVRGHDAQTQAVHQRYATLTPRERDVMGLVVSGWLNKLVARELGFSEITVKAHRGSVMRKVCSRSLADLVRMASEPGLEPRPKR